jgi:hypothetical protein
LEMIYLPVVGLCIVWGDRDKGVYIFPPLDEHFADCCDFIRNMSVHDRSIEWC